ncbi:uncharacterized protein LOC129219437 [Uloborus diversus]|uniref:uncharacterized protein LOC129219437 n=1 Tax=Uloborus diversus TaxID=327109 RepID=UPI0024095DAE|nr:uncharacterized protein LOC129219437 [Uloborus diversus]
MSLDFFPEETFIEMVQRNPVLYNISKKGYKDHLAKENCWKAISESINVPVSTCKSKWKCLRDYYTRNRKAKPTGTAAEFKSFREKQRMQALSFLANTSCIERTTFSNVAYLCSQPINSLPAVLEVEPTTSHEVEPTTSHEVEPTTSHEVEPTTSHEVDLSTSWENCSQVEDSLSQQPAEFEAGQEDLGNAVKKGQKRKLEKSSAQGKVSVRDRFLKEMRDNQLQRTECIKSLLDPKEDRNPIDDFCLSIGSILKTLPRKLMLQAKQEIFAVASKFESLVPETE